MTDLLSKWIKKCKTVEEIRQVATKQLLNTLPGDICIWVSEHKPKTAEEAGQLADDCVQARGHSRRMERGNCVGEQRSAPWGVNIATTAGGWDTWPGTAIRWRLAG